MNISQGHDKAFVKLQIAKYLTKHHLVRKLRSEPSYRSNIAQESHVKPSDNDIR